MPDWGGIGGANAAAGFLNGFTQSYTRGRAQEAAIAAHQESRLLDLYAQAIQADPTITTNPGFYAGMQASGLGEQAVGTLTTLGHLIASQPATQQADQQRMFLGKLRGQIMDKYGSAEGPSMDPNQMTAAEGALIGGAPLAQAIGSDRKGTGGSSKAGKPTVSYHSFENNGKKITRKTIVNPDGTITETDEGTSVLAPKRGTIKPLSPKERDDIAGVNSYLQALDDLETQMAQPENRALLGKRAIAKRALGGVGDFLAPRSGLGGYLESSGRSTGQEDFVTLVSKFKGEELHRLYGAALTKGEAAVGERQVPDITLDPAQFKGRIAATRRRLLSALEKKLTVLRENHVADLPTAYVSTQHKGSARRAVLLNRKITAGATPQDATPAVGPGATMDDTDAALLDAWKQ